MQCADRVVVLRDGHMVGALTRAELSPEAMIRLMIGRDLKSLYVPPAAPPGEAVLDIVDARHRHLSGAARSACRCARGEILGLAGLVGSGRTELARAIFGVDRLQRGAIRLDGEPIQLTSPRAAIAQGIYLIPEDRKGCGLLLDVSIAENISLPDLTSYLRLWLVDTARETENAKSQRERLKIRAPDVATSAGALSGGNQQKVVLAKWLSMRPKVMIFDEPTRGIDVGAKQEIYDMLRRLTDAGVAILMISSDMEEVIGVSDRIAVMHEGAISGFLERSQFSEHNVLQLAVGHGSVGEGTRAEERSQPADPDPGGRRRRRLHQSALPVAGNLSNTANQVGLFGIFSIGEACVIIIGGIDLSVGSVFALLGVLFIDLIVNRNVDWVTGLRADDRWRARDRRDPRPARHQDEDPALRGHAVRPFDLSWRRALLHRGFHRRLRLWRELPELGMADRRRTDVFGFPLPHSVIALVIVTAIAWVVLHRSVFGRYLYAVGKNEEAARYSGIRSDRVVISRLRDLRRAHGVRGGPVRDVHALDLAGGAWLLL